RFTFFRFGSILFLLFCLVCIPLSASAEVTVQYPSSVGVGKPFLVRVTSSVPLTGVEVVWQGRTVQLGVSVWNERYISLALLGTQVGKVKTGDHRLTLRLLSGGKRSEHPFSIKVTPV